ncbi:MULTISPECIES: hypothetical protein [Nostoc]|uniref:Uncharacterized protein n=1 Tax=Nostoc paludosum FACHB-159 TaxID=2692908 RepID=A0ABR8K6S4_9NOSO|nr:MULTISPECIES: hypothetical protein [Nostoc]MBD2677845.1 hypothetical protein [Nostoc sp. FACHB-857]MBD2733980.1 hypothetical protein [Nostoc paludosum FACHB-159]
MQQKFALTLEEKQKIFHTQLVKYGVEYEKARKASEILAREKPDEVLTQEEIQLTKEACNHWSAQRKRIKQLMSLLNSDHSATLQSPDEIG